MGNSNALPYDILESIDYNGNNHWTLNQGVKKTDSLTVQKQNVAIFRFPKVAKQDKVPLAQRHVQKLRTIRYPYILTYLDSTEMDDSLVLITEPCVPLEVWFTKVVNDPAVPKQNLIYELHWGFKCVLQALDFLHSNCSVIHGNLGLHSIFVTPNGDWKLGSFELASNMNNQDDINHFISHQNILDKYYCSQERQTLVDKDPAKIDAVLKAKIPPFYIDMYSFGQCVHKAFSMLNEELTGSFSKHIATTVNTDIKKRPTAKKLVQTSTFTSDYIKILENVQEFSLKGPKEILEAIKQLDPLLPQMPVAICSYKVLPSVCRVLQISINDFQIRDARESCRQAIVVCVDLLSKLGELKKLDESTFQQECIGILTQLWTMTDRTIRTSMLSSLKNLSDLISREAVNKSIFDNILAGFSDSNAKLRESTLMSLIFVVDKLDESQLQDRLVRCVGNLQNDPEASIRTNTTIFIGKIAAKLKEPVRVKVLCNALAKAMKDNFIHCRIAGLKTSIACLKFMDPVQLATKIIPQASILLLDRSVDVRNLAISLLEGGLSKMKQNHEEMIEEAKHNNHKEEERDRKSSQESSQQSSEVSSWSSWSGSMLQGLSKTIEGTQTPSAISASSTTVNPSSVGGMKLSERRDLNSSFSELDLSGANKGMSTTGPTMKFTGSSGKNNFLDEFDDDFGDNDDKPAKVSSLSSKPTSSKGWGDDNWDDFDDDNDDAFASQPAKVSSLGVSASKPSQSTSSMATKKSQWDDDLDDALDFNDEDDEDVYRPPPKEQKHVVASTPVLKTPIISEGSSPQTSGKSIESRQISSASSVTTPVAPSAPVSTGGDKSSKAKPVKVAVKKLEVTKDDWEDF